VSETKQRCLLTFSFTPRYLRPPLTRGPLLLEGIIMIKRISLLAAILFSTSGFAASVEGPQMLLLSCKSSDSNQYRFLEVYGTIGDDDKVVTNVAVVSSLASDFSELKMLIPGGTGHVSKDSKLTYADVIESGSSLEVDGKTSVWTFKNQKIIFSNCR
jgi:hypothetical protein